MFKQRDGYTKMVSSKENALAREERLYEGGVGGSVALKAAVEVDSAVNCERTRDLLTFAESERRASLRGGRLATTQEVRALLKSMKDNSGLAAIFRDEDQWVAVRNSGTEDWIQVGSGGSEHPYNKGRTGWSYKEKYGKLPQWHDDAGIMLGDKGGERPQFRAFCYVKDAWLASGCREMENGDIALPYSMAMVMKKLENHDSYSGQVDVKMLLILRIKLTGLVERTSKEHVDKVIEHL